MEEGGTEFLGEKGAKADALKQVATKYITGTIYSCV